MSVQSAEPASPMGRVTIGLGERISTQLENDVFAVNVQFSHTIQGHNAFLGRSLFLLP